MEKGLIQRRKLLDILIVGGGPAGATTGLLLAQAGWSVGIVEKKKFPRRKVCGEFISATSLPLLKKLGIADFYESSSGPEVRRIALYAGITQLTSSMPSANSASKWGRAIGRECLDTALLDQAISAGVKLWQPATALNVQQSCGHSTLTLNINGQIETISAQITVVANGSWESPITHSKHVHKASDLLAFKAHFKSCDLATDLMPLIAFPGGYGGMVHTDHDRVTLSCCIRRDALQSARLHYAGIQAGEAVLHFIKTSTLGVNEALANAVREGSWLAAGPIKPGIRQCYNNGQFFVGNIAGEAHPVVAEGISMAMQAAWILSQSLIAQQDEIHSKEGLAVAGALYSQQWKKNFAKRIHAASLFAQLAMQPWSHKVILSMIKQFPSLLTLGAKFSGKTQFIVPAN